MLVEGNKFTDSYYRLLNGEKLFDVELCENRNVYKFNPSEEIFSICYEIAKVKSGVTMDEDQFGVPRTKADKLERQFEGCIAEFASAKYLIDFCNIPIKDIYVYDALRKSFSYNLAEEYDICIVKNGNYSFGIKNSKSYKTTLNGFIQTYHLIADYISPSKRYEKIDDFHIRPVIQYIKMIPKMPHSSYDSLTNGESSLYLIGAATKEQVKNEGYPTEMGFKKTKYSVVSMKDTYTMEQLTNLIKDL